MKNGMWRMAAAALVRIRGYAENEENGERRRRDAEARSGAGGKSIDNARWWR
jgi:hypothetical protein